MLPTLIPGDMVLVLRWFPAHRGQIVVARLGNRFIIKRVERLDGGRVQLMGDNPEAEQHLKPFSRSDLVGVVFFVQKANEDARFDNYLPKN